MSLLYNLFLLPLLAVYCAVFVLQEKLFTDTRSNLQAIPSFQLVKAATGYLHQISAEILFVKEAVFLGGIKAGTDEASFAPVLSNNYRQITLLYPEFVDPYYYSQAYLPHLGLEFAQDTNDILATGISHYPNNFLFRLYSGVNSFQYLDAPLAAAKTFEEASKQPDAPPIFSHLAAILSAQGGNLQAAIITLQIMVKGEEDETVKKRYHEEIEMFKKAMLVSSQQSSVG
ncbi:MAG: hypothetical protein OEL83_20875 [Desulforhopalus sp.]|nr:hypothetical protein [Desulforhopalus sp.]